MKKRLLKQSILTILLLSLLLFSACSNKSVSTSNNADTLGIQIHYINVGQADSILISQGNHSMLIDAGNNEDGKNIVSYLQQNNIKNLDYVIGTHPHADHIGGLDNIINNFSINKLYMPKKVNTTRTYKDVLLASKRKNLNITIPKCGESFKLGEAICTIVAPQNKDYDNINNYSIVLKIVYKNTSYLFTGDAENVSEKEILNNRYDIKSDVLKIGHHGSHTATTDTFLNSVNPKFAIISCGKDNDYGHPHKSTMDKLKTKHIPIYRTDECGTIILISDGTNINFNVNPGSYKYPIKKYKNKNKNKKINFSKKKKELGY